MERNGDVVAVVVVVVVVVDDDVEGRIMPTKGRSMPAELHTTAWYIPRSE